jgi:ABC-type antimicrobial peptide transport system ATPase subunit
LRQADRRRTNFATTEDELEASHAQFAGITTGIELARRAAPVVSEVLAAMQQLASDGTTMVVVTHETSFATDVVHRIVFMDGGVIVEEGKPHQVLFAPQTERVWAFLRRYNDSYRT